ncbi:hypothetical protein PM082_019285 [Marasmius tenuissimus]|nr:hypothetical protein PM082_019285 [Marasmius tenuissimus]
MIELERSAQRRRPGLVQYKIGGGSCRSTFNGCRQNESYEFAAFVTHPPPHSIGTSLIFPVACAAVETLPGRADWNQEPVHAVTSAFLQYLVVRIARPIATPEATSISGLGGSRDVYLMSRLGRPAGL